MNNSNVIKLINENGVAKEYGEIPDLWHTAQYLSELVQDHPGLAGACEQVLQVWHMAHDLKSVIEKQDQAKLVDPAPVELPKDLGYVIELASHRADMWKDYAGGVDIHTRLSEFYECDQDEAESIANDTAGVVRRTQAWFKEVK